MTFPKSCIVFWSSLKILTACTTFHHRADDTALRMHANHQNDKVGITLEQIRDNLKDRVRVLDFRLILVHTHREAEHREPVF